MRLRFDQQRLRMLMGSMRSFSSSRLSVTMLLIASIGLFATVIFVALPSARILVWPRMSLVSHTANVLLVESGSTVNIDRKNVLELLPIKTMINRSMTFNEVSKKFMGENAKVEMTIVNESEEPYSLRSGTRLANQAGMIFRLTESVTIPASTIGEHGIVTVDAEAMPEDLYGQIVGERGNVPEGLKWEILGLPVGERTLVYARNSTSAVGGRTAYGNELHEKDLELAKKQLEQELMKAAKIRTEEEVESLQVKTGDHYVILQYDVLTAMAFSGVMLPTDLISQDVSSIPVEGTLSYKALVYNKNALLSLLLTGLREHVDDGKELISDSISIDGISVHVIEYDDNLQWVKITAELTGKQRAVLSSATVTGREFRDRAFDAIRGKTVSEAARIIQNFPEVERVEVKVWPPWRRSLPSLMSNIVLLPQ